MTDETDMIEKRNSRARRGRVAVAWGAAACALAAALWLGVIEPHLAMKRWGVVVPDRLFRSGQLGRSVAERALTRHHIRTVIDLSEERADDADQVALGRVIQKLGLRHYRMPLSGDGRGDFHHYTEAFRLVQTAPEGEAVLVHCSAGAQRTGAFVFLYRVLFQQRSVEEALAEMRRFGWDPKNNAVLTVYLNQHMEDIARELVVLGLLEKIPDPLPRLPE